MTFRKLPPLSMLRSFEAAARHISFARAGAELGAQPTKLVRREVGQVAPQVAQGEAQRGGLAVGR